MRWEGREPFPFRCHHDSGNNKAASLLLLSFAKVTPRTCDRPASGHSVSPLRVCLNFIRPSWNGWNGTRLFVVVRSIPTCFQVFVSIPTTKRKSWNSCELSAIGNILDCQYKTRSTIVTHRLQVGCLEHTRAPLPPLLLPFSRHDYNAARTHAVPWGEEGGSGPEARQQ